MLLHVAHMSHMCTALLHNDICICMIDRHTAERGGWSERVRALVFTRLAMYVSARARLSRCCKIMQPTSQAVLHVRAKRLILSPQHSSLMLFLTLSR